MAPSSTTFYFIPMHMPEITCDAEIQLQTEIQNIL
jgi:hypothetical protein